LESALPFGKKFFVDVALSGVQPFVRRARVSTRTIWKSLSG
jgi:hypothetical protein